MTLEELRQYILGALDKAIGIRDEQRMMANTAKRVGGDLVDIVEILRTLFSDYLDQALRTFDDVEFQKLVLRESFKTADFIPGVLGAGTGMVGTEDFTTGKLTVRNYMEVMALAIAQVFWRGGQDVYSPSGMKVNKVEEYDDYWRCYMETSKGQKNTCTVGAQMRCNKYGDDRKKYYWNLVTSTGENYIDLSKTDRDGVDVPEVGDELAQFGHRTDPNLSWILVISSMLEDVGMTMYAGVDSYTLSGKWAIRVGKAPDGSNRVGIFTKNGEFSDVIEGLEDKVDNIQIGGANLINQFNADGTTTWFPSDSTAKVSVNNGVIRGEYVGIADAHYPRVCNKSVRNIVLDLDSEYTVSFKIRSNKLAEVAYGISDSNSSNRVMPQVHSPVLSENFIEVKNTFKPLKQISSGNIFYIYITLDFGVGKTAWIEVKDVKIEKGNKVTDFSYSQSDNEVRAQAIAKAEAELAETKANAYADGIVTEAEQNAINEAQARLDAIKFGTVNLISRKMMLGWNEKNKDIAVWGQDSDGIYLSINPRFLYDSIGGSGSRDDIFENKIKYKSNTQYVFSIEWKAFVAQTTTYDGLMLDVHYTDGTYELLFSTPRIQSTKTRTDFITKKGKTIQKISCTYGTWYVRTLIYSLALYEGNKVLTEIPVATEDLQGQSNVNLVDGGKEFTIEANANNYNYKELKVPLLKPNTVYHISFKTENLLGSPTVYTSYLYKKDNSGGYVLLHSASGGIMITPNDFTETEAKLFLYAGQSSHTNGNSVKYTEVTLVEGFTPPSSYSPSPGDVAKDIKDVNDAVANLNATINGAFKDGIIDEAEAKAIASNINILNAEKADIDNAYTPLYNSPYLLSGTTAANNLNNAKTAYNTAHANLISAINTAIADKKVTSTEKANVDAKFTAYNSTLGTYKKRVEEANKAIQDRIKVLAEQDATNKVDGIQIGGTNLFPISRLNTVGYRGNSSKEGYDTEIIFKCNAPQAWAIIPVSIPTPVVPTNTDFIISMDIRNTNGFGFEVTATSGTPTIFGKINFENTTSTWKRISKRYNSGDKNNIGGINLWGVGDVRHIKIEIGNKATDWSPAPEDIDQAIQNAIAKTVDITAPSQVFKYGAGYTGTPTPASIVLTAIPKNFTPTSYQWQYLNGSTWTNISGATSSTYSVAPGNTTLFPSGVYTRTFRCICNGDEKLSDNFTLAKLADGATGAAGKDAYTILLTNESHAFAGSVSAAVAGATSCAVAAYKGATQVVATIGSITGLPAGMTASIANNGTTTAIITFTVTTSMKTASGTVNIPITVDGKSFTRVFSYSIAFKGAIGQTGATGQPGESINGKMLYKDPEFKLGMNGVARYSNAPDDILAKLTLERITKPSDAPTQSGYCLKVTCKAAQSPGYGGVYQSITSRANAVFVQKIIAKIPVGYKINTASNSMGTGYTDTWLTPTEGTGKYTTYLRKVVCGATGTFSTGGHVYITGNPAPSESVPLEWYIAFMTCFDQTSDGYADIEIVTKDSFAVQLGFTSFEALKANALTKGPLIKAGLINADVIDVNTLAANDALVDKLRTNILKANVITANMLSVAGFTFADNKIIGGKDFGTGAGIKITSIAAEKSFKAYKDASNYISMFYNSDSDWGLKGVVGGAELLKLGITNKIGPFTIEGSWLRGSNLALSGSQLNFSYSGHQVYVGSHPDMTTAGNAKLGTFMLSGGGYGGLGSNKQVALIAGAPNNVNSYAMAVTQGMLKMFPNASIVSGVYRAYMTGSNPGITLGNEHPNFICLYGTGNRKKINLYAGMEIGKHFIITSEASQGFDILCTGSEKFYRNGNTYVAVQSSGQDSVLVMKVDTYKWTACQMPINWLGTWNP